MSSYAIDNKHCSSFVYSSFSAKSFPHPGIEERERLSDINAWSQSGKHAGNRIERSCTSVRRSRIIGPRIYAVMEPIRSFSSIARSYWSISREIEILRLERMRKSASKQLNPPYRTPGWWALRKARSAIPDYLLTLSYFQATISFVLSVKPNSFLASSQIALTWIVILLFRSLGSSRQISAQRSTATW